MDQMKKEISKKLLLQPLTIDMLFFNVLKSNWIAYYFTSYMQQIFVL